MEYRYRPQGVCSTEMIFEIEEDVVKKAKIVNGCAGNTAGVCTLIEGMKIEDIIKKLKGIPCGRKGTSCPDQLARALEQFLKQK